MKRGLPPKYAGTALSIILWSWMNLRLDSGSSWESWEHFPGRGEGTWKIIRTFCNFPIVCSHLHVSDWQPIWVGSLLFFKWTLESVQNIADLKGTNSIPTNGVLWCGEHSVDDFCCGPSLVGTFHYGAHRFCKGKCHFWWDCWMWGGLMLV